VVKISPVTLEDVGQLVMARRPAWTLPRVVLPWLEMSQRT
jgi:hypothetical protein